MKKNSKTPLSFIQMTELKNKIQKEAIEAVMAEYALAKAEGRAPKATINLATGAGKTVTAYKLIFQNGEFKTILFMVPKQSLIDQSIEEFVNQGVEFDYCTVYTHGNVESVEELHAFLAQPTDRKKIVFAVYNSVGITEDKTSIFNDSDFVFDLAIYDECHRVAGKEISQFTSCVTDEVVKAHHKLFMTATVKFYLESEDASENLNEFSMKNTDIFGKIVKSVTVFEAIEMGILCNFETYLLEVSDEQIRKALRKKVMFYNAEAKGRHVATFYGVLNAYNQGARKIVVMYREIADANDFTRLFQYLQKSQGMFEGAVIGSVASSATRFDLGAPYQYPKGDKTIVIGNNKRKAQQWWLKEGPFCNAESAIAVSTPWIKEGEDVPCIDCIVFGDRFASPIDIIQIIGRALRWYPGKNIARIILPIMEGEANKVANVIQATVGSLQEKVDDFQITHVEHTTEHTPDPANGQNEEQETSDDHEANPRQARWIFTEDQDGMTTLVTNNEMSISVIHSTTSSELTRLEHEQMMQNIGLKVSHRFRQYLRDQRAEKFIDEQIGLINEKQQGLVTKNFNNRKIQTNQAYYEMYAKRYSLTIEKACEELSKHIVKIENLRNNFLGGMFQF